MPPRLERRRDRRGEILTTRRIVYDVEGWAYHNRARALQKYAPPDFDVSIGMQGKGGDLGKAVGDREVDLLFVICLPQAGLVPQLLRARGWKTKLIGSWNSGWPLQIPEFHRVYHSADALVINNQTAWERMGRVPRTFAIAHGVDLDQFAVRTPIGERKPKVLWTGSHYARRRKGYEAFMLPLQAMLEAVGIDCELLFVDSYGTEKRSREEMAAWYNTGTVLVCTSAVEGTPNPALEAAACGCTVVSTPVGNMPELIRDGVNGYLVERELRSIFEAVRRACGDYPRLAAAMQEDIREWSWEKRAPTFFEMFRRVHAQDGVHRLDRLDRRRPRDVPDLSDRVTVFVTTVGAASYQACLDHLAEQDCRFGLEIIDSVAPMNAAFQRMLDRCKTPFFVQVDEDMLLYPQAVRTLCESIEAEPPNVAMFFADLYDAHLERPIVGVKIYRHEVVRRYPFTDVQSFEKLQVRQMRADGYDVGFDRAGPHVLGLHGTHWTTQSIFERYATLESRRRRHPRELEWFTEYPPLFIRRVLEDPSDLNFFALMGVIAGATPSGADRGDKDFRSYKDLPGLAEARRLYEELLRPAESGTAGPERPALVQAVDAEKRRRSG